MSRRITITPAKATLEVRYNGTVIARSDKAQMLAEEGHEGRGELLVRHGR